MDKGTRCIFCASISDGSQSQEHILPEALGNEDHVLPSGVVCDGCNNYFGTKIEGPLLDTLHFNNLRARQELPNKKRRLPMMRGVFPAAGVPIGLQRTDEGVSIGALRESDNNRFVKTLLTREKASLWIPIDGHVDERILSRFLAKVAVEMFADRLLKAGEPLSILIGIPQLVVMRRFARYGSPPLAWPIHRRRIYDEHATFGSGTYQVLHEFDFLYTAGQELFAVICIFGEEFAINLGGPSIDGYVDFLKQQGGRSPLYEPGELESATSGR
jgi:hypothetical protein